MSQLQTARLENWGTVLCGTIFDPPECRWTRIRGHVFGHPRHEDGDIVLLSDPVALDRVNRTVTTRNTVYTLGDPSDAWQREFPNAEARFFDFLAAKLSRAQKPSAEGGRK